MVSISNTTDWRVIESDAIAVGSSVDLALVHEKPPCFLGITLYDSEGAVVTSGATGTFSILIQTHLSEEVWQSPSPAVSIDVASYADVNWLAPTEAVRVTPTSITGATTYRVRVIQYSAG